jgi:hypothetical protein
MKGTIIYKVPAGNPKLDGTAPICGLEDAIRTLRFVCGMKGTPDVRFLNSRTIDGYVPPSAGKIGGRAVRVKPIPGGGDDEV